MGNILQFIIHNFSHVAPILGAAAFGLIIIFERVKTILLDYSFPQAEVFLEKIKYLIMADRVSEAVGLCEHLKHKPVVRVALEGLLRADQAEGVIEDGLKIAVGELTEKIGERIYYLSTIANVSTLFGLFGTIIGLVQSFEAVGGANAQERASLLAQGISTAMNATLMGLGVAIPCMIAFSFLTARSNKLISEVDRTAVKVLDLLKQRYYSWASAQDDFDKRRRNAVGGSIA